MKIQGKQLYVSMQCTCIDINMAELRESGESMQFLKVKLYTIVVHNLQMYMQEYRCCLKFRRRDNLTDETVF
jgi:hypothetical protein